MLYFDAQGEQFTIAPEDRQMIHNDPLRTLDMMAIEREARRLRAEAFAQMVRGAAQWFRAKLTARSDKALGHTA